MPRTKRIDIRDYCYHLINRANGRQTIFLNDDDYLLFETVLETAQNKFDVQIFAYTIMPNHFHLVVQPNCDGELSKFMQWLTLTHTQRWHQAKGSSGTGHLYQGRYKSFLIQKEDHLFTVIKYVERNALRAKLVIKAEHWRYSSLWRREKGTKAQKDLLSVWPVGEPNNYLEIINRSDCGVEEENIKTAIVRGSPYGGADWMKLMITKFELESTIRVKGRPRKI